MSKRKPIVGEKLFSLNVGNAARRGAPQVLTRVIVMMVGRKLFRCRDEANLGSAWCEVVYHLEDWREKSNYSASSVLYESEQERADEVEEISLTNALGEAFRHGHNIKSITLDRLRKMVELLNAR